MSARNINALWKALNASSLRCQVFLNYTLKLINMGLTLASSVILARVLGANEFGLYSFAYAFVMILAIVAEVGLPTLVVRETANGMVHQDHALVLGIWEWAVKAAALLSLGLMLLAGVFLAFSKLFPVSKVHVTMWALLAVPLLAIGDVRNAALRGLDKIIVAQLPEFLLRPIFHIVFVLLVFRFNTHLIASATVQLYVFSSLLAFIIGICLWNRYVPKDMNIRPRYKTQEWQHSMVALGVLEVTAMFNLYIATIIQGAYTFPNADIGAFRVAQQISQLAGFGLAVNLALGPRFAALYSQRDMQGLQKLATLSARATFLIYLGIGAFFLFFGRAFIRVLFGMDYIGAYGWLLILLLGQSVNAVVGSVGWILNMANQERTVAWAMAVSALANVALNLVLLPRIGVAGSAWAATISMALWNLWLWWCVWKKLGIVSSPIFIKLPQIMPKRFL